MTGRTKETPLALRVRACIGKHRLVRPGDRVAIAVSGGPDSVALLRVLLELRSELGVVLSVAHFNHHIRGADSEADAAFVAELAQNFSLELHSASGQASAHAKKESTSLETAARELRYQFFHGLLAKGAANAVATGHTLDDQAETVLMKLLRGAGTKGLAGIHPVLKVGHGIIIRPLLDVRRTEIEAYLRSLGQAWREDATNLELHHTRNRVRRELIPLLERDFNPSLAATLAETAELSRAEEEYWSALAAGVLPSVFNGHTCSVTVVTLLEKPLALQRRLLRAAAAHAGMTLEFEHVEELRELMAGPPSQHSKTLDLPGGRAVFHKNPGGELRLEFRQPWQDERDQPPSDYEYRLAWPCELKVKETGSAFKLKLIAPGKSATDHPELINPDLLQRELCLRNWRAGDRFWPAHSGSAKKIKELLQRVPQAERRSWPVITSGDEVIWMRGFPPNRRLVLSAGERKSKPGLLIEELLNQ